MSEGASFALVTRGAIILNAKTGNKRIQVLGFSSGLQLSIGLAVWGMDLIPPDRGDLGAGKGRLPHW